MDSKLTLRMDRDIISRMKLLAQKESKSLSGLTEDLYKQVLNEQANSSDRLSPIAKKYLGILKDKEIDEEMDRLAFVGRKHS